MSHHVSNTLDARVPEPVPIRINSSGDLAATIPALLGFRPEQSLVLLFLADRTLALTARYDLPVESSILDQVQALAHQTRATTCIAAAYCPRDDFAVHAATVGDLQRALAAAAADLMDLLLIDDDRYWNVMTDAPSGEGTVVPGTSELGAHQVTAGHPVVAGSRQEEVDHYQWAPDPCLDRDVLTPAHDALSESLMDQARATWTASMRLVTAYEADDALLQAAVVLVGIQDPRIRDYVLLQATISVARPISDDGCLDQRCASP